MHTIFLVSFLLDPFAHEISDGENLGASICGCFVFFGALSVMLYKPWRRWIDRCRTRAFLQSEENNIEVVDGSPSNGLDITQSGEEAMHAGGKDRRI
jgi:hypothetical protein